VPDEVVGEEQRRLRQPLGLAGRERSPAAPFDERGRRPLAPDVGDRVEDLHAKRGERRAIGVRRGDQHRLDDAFAAQDLHRCQDTRVVRLGKGDAYRPLRRPATKGADEPLHAGHA
jgi:hypothetical protein